MKFRNPTSQENRRAFVRRCFGIGAGVAAIPAGTGQGAGPAKVRLPGGSPETGMSEYERILSHTDSMHVLGNPRSWSLVSQGFHPFAPERVAVLPSDDRIDYHDRCGKDLRRYIDERIKIEFDRLPGRDPSSFPESKRESIYWIVDTMIGHYGVRSQFREWVVGLAGREIIGSTAFCACGLAHQYQRGGHAPVDCAPVDWWLFLFPGGIDWAALDASPVFAVIAHVFQNDPYARSWSGMFPVWVLTQEIWRTDPDWSQIAQMGRLGACRHLNRIVAQCLTNKPL